jgi:hypothetical protein
MGIRSLPKTDHDILISMWTLLVGTNGEGLLGKFETFSDETRKHLTIIDAQLPKMWTRKEQLAAECAESERSAGEKNRRRISLREWALIGLTATSVLFMGLQSLIMFLGGKG